MMKIAIATAVVLYAGIAVFATPVSATAVKHAKKAATKVAKLICPVTGETIPSIADAAGKSTYKGKTYYFCCGGCKPMFDKNPAKYIKSASAGKPKSSGMKM